MITNIIIILWFLFVVVMVGLMFYRIHNKDKLFFLFQNYSKVEIPYIILDVQGHPLNMIVDSGAAVSVITQEALGIVNYKPCLRSIDISATTAESLHANMVTIPITVNSRTLDEDFVVHPVEDLANFKAMHNIVAHGILGNEFFEKTGCKIDYKNHSVTLY